jgi:hypothetical protein
MLIHLTTPMCEVTSITKSFFSISVELKLLEIEVTSHESFL